MTKHPLRPLAAALSILLSAQADPARAQSSPWYVGGSVGMAYDSNIYRLADGQPTPAGLSKDDRITTYSLLGGLDQPIGRQRLLGSVSLRDSRFADNTQLDNKGYSASLGLDWQTVERLSGTVSYVTDRSLANFDTSSGSATNFERNTQDTQRFAFLGRIGVVTDWSGEAGLTWRRVNYSLERYQYLDNEQAGFSLGVRHRPGTPLDLGAALRVTRGKYPNYFEPQPGVFAADRYERRDIDFTANYRPRGASVYSARISLGSTQYEEATQRDFRGVTGDLTWDWRVSGKTRLRTTLLRETGQDSNFYDLGNSIVTVSDFSRVTTSLRVRGDWEATGKIAVNAGLVAAYRDLVNTLPGSTGDIVTASGNDKTLTLTLGATWAATRWSLLGCNVVYEKRNTNTTLSYDYGAGNFGCYAQIMLQ